MAERIMLALGEFRFEIATAAYQKLAYSQSWRWPEPRQSLTQVA